jgi:hypothetical protein
MENKTINITGSYGGIVTAVQVRVKGEISESISTYRGTR